MKKVRKAVITAAGWGTRFLPITKSLPKPDNGSRGEKKLTLGDG